MGFKDPKVFWASVFGLAALRQAYSLRRHDGGTFSETTRSVIPIDRGWGRWLFLVLWGLISSWYPVHILEKADQQLRDILKDEEERHGSE